MIADVAGLPPIFSPYAFGAGRGVARSQGRLLLVDVMAHWCPPCRMMDESTWRDAELIDWVQANAIAIQVDAEADRETAGLLEVRAYPTVIVLRGDAEVGRLTGFRGAHAMLDWLHFLATGETASQRLTRTLDREHDLLGRLRLARAFFEERFSDEATKEYVSLWKLAPGILDTRSPIFRQHLEQLVQTHAPARAAFTDLRDAAEKKARLDWVILNDVLGETRRTFEWFSRVKSDPAMTPLFQTCATPRPASHRPRSLGRDPLHSFRSASRACSRDRRARLRRI